MERAPPAVTGEPAVSIPSTRKGKIVSTVLEIGEPVMRRPQSRMAFDPPKSIAIVEGPELRSGTPTAVGFIPAGILIPDGHVIPYYDTRTKKGYQRPPQDARINQLVSDLRKDRTDL